MHLEQLSPKDYPAVQTLFTPLNFNLVIRSVMEGHTPAWVFATPQRNAALIWDRQDAVLIAGQADEESSAGLREVILQHILPDAQSRYIPELALFYTPAWAEHLPRLLAKQNPQLTGRISFRLPTHFAPGELYPPQGFTLQRIDDSLLASHLVNLDQVRGWIDSFWFSEADFLHTGFGYCALTGNTIAAWCLTVFAGGNSGALGASRELGLATIPEFRNRGLATLVASACLQHGLAHQMALHWHCWADNLPSIAVAKKIGFTVERAYQVYKIAIEAEEGA